MGFITSGNTLVLSAKLTPLGRKQLISTNTSLITSFSLGDSDANYYATYPLGSGQVPTQSGELGANNLVNNSTPSNQTFKSLLVVNSNGVFKKPVETQSTTIISQEVINEMTTLSASSLTQNFIDRASGATDSLVNLFYSFGLPVDAIQDNKFQNTLYANGGYADTAFSGLGKTKIAVIGIDNNAFGETIDGKNLKITLPTSGGTYNIYGSYQRTSASLLTQDANIRDTSLVTNAFGDNVVLLFSDEYLPPNNNIDLSWSTGFNSTRPYSVGNKQLFNLQTNTSLNQTADGVVGIAFLDMGMIVLTEPNLINNYANTPSSGLTVSFKSVSTDISQNITCVAGRGEFGTSNNPTIGSNDNPRISEVILYDNVGNVIAVAKTNTHVTKNINEFLALGIKISL